MALLLQAEPDLTPDQVKYRLIHTAQASGNLALGDKSYPYLDVHAAVTGATTESANTGIAASQMLWSGDDPVLWDSVNWNSVNWNSVNWNSVNWNSVNWNSVNWNSVYWDDSEPTINAAAIHSLYLPAVRSPVTGAIDSNRPATVRYHRCKGIPTSHGSLGVFEPKQHG